MRHAVRRSVVRAWSPRPGVICRAWVGLLLVAWSGLGAEPAAPVTLADVDTITIMPVAFPADPARVDRDEPLEGLYGELDDYIYKALLRKLALKGYVLDRPRGWERPPDWTVEMLKSLPPAQLARLLPASASYAALLMVESVESASHGVASEASARVSARIMHRASGTVVWDGMRTGEFHDSIGQFLLYGPLMMLITPDRHAAVEQAFSLLFAGLPGKTY